MHEVSIVRALASQVQRHLPRPVRVRRVRVRIGALQAVEPAALELAWQAVTQGGALEGAALEVKMLPWNLHCTRCGRWWSSGDPLAACCCGERRCHPYGSDEIVLMSIDVDSPEAESEERPCESRLLKTC